METSKSPDRSISLLVRSIYLTGLLLPLLECVVIWTYFAARGGLASWAEGVIMVAIPLAILSSTPFLCLAMLTRHVLLAGTYTQKTKAFQKWWCISVGAFTGTTLTLGYLLFTILQNRFEIVYWIGLGPLIVLIVIAELIYATGGALIGGIAGALTWVMKDKLGP